MQIPCRHLLLRLHRFSNIDPLIPRMTLCHVDCPHLNFVHCPQRNSTAEPICLAVNNTPSAFRNFADGLRTFPYGYQYARAWLFILVTTLRFDIPLTRMKGLKAGNQSLMIPVKNDEHVFLLIYVSAIR